MNERHLGRPAASSTIPAIHWRTATTPAGPIAPNASAPVAAPSWFDRAPPNIMAGPAHGREPGRTASFPADREPAGPEPAGPEPAGPEPAGPEPAGGRAPPLT